jgi:hypothetical protein
MYKLTLIFFLIIGNRFKKNQFKCDFLLRVPTRWNSLFYMLDRLNAQKMAIRTFLNDTDDQTIPELSNYELAIIDELINIISPLEQATKYMSGDKYFSMSLMIATLSGLVIRLIIIKIKNSALQEIRDHIIQSLKSRFAEIENNEYSTITACELR